MNHDPAWFATFLMPTGTSQPIQLHRQESETPSRECTHVARATEIMQRPNRRLRAYTHQQKQRRRRHKRGGGQSRSNQHRAFHNGGKRSRITAGGYGWRVYHLQEVAITRQARTRQSNPPAPTWSLVQLLGGGPTTPRPTSHDRRAHGSTSRVMRDGILTHARDVSLAHRSNSRVPPP